MKRQIKNARLFFFQYRATRIKTGKCIDPVRINKTLGSIRSFHFSPSITQFPAKRASNWFPFSASSLIPSTMRIVMRNSAARRDVWLCAMRIRIHHKDVEHSVNEFHAFTSPPPIARSSVGPWNSNLKGVWRPLLGVYASIRPIDRPNRTRSLASILPLFLSLKLSNVRYIDRTFLHFTHHIGLWRFWYDAMYFFFFFNVFFPVPADR